MNLCIHGMPSNQCITCKISLRCEHGAPLTCVACRQSSQKVQPQGQVASQPKAISAKAGGGSTASPRVRGNTVVGAVRPASVPGQDPRLQVIDRIAAKHSIVRRGKWGARSPNYGTMDRDWDYTTVVIHHSGNGGGTDPKAD
ncbi:hypothetical protein [Cystobacter fuscus]|nr:hypothetical protein [Cystobacter fuscus]